MHNKAKSSKMSYACVLRKNWGCVCIHWYVFIILNLDLSVLGFWMFKLQNTRKAVKDYKAVDFVGKYRC